ncbi:hypothetical protein [Thetidibacter halocola]|uniref:Uncharacterized protein n=1 Tax=Thetidibacter halocola TaxID=2827239 RepID=A0A8J7WEI6_9RHOB|nr:hypothetical protein [Thetidibacter halocola]MBS0125322.1 hypothetical protein [Thetidibacter halocola]
MRLASRRCGYCYTDKPVYQWPGVLALFAVLSAATLLLAGLMLVAG